MITIQDKNHKLHEVEGYLIQLPGYPQLKVAVHPKWTNKDPAIEGIFRVTELTTGTWIGEGYTEQEAIQHALSRLKGKTDAEIQAVIERNKIRRQTCSGQS